MEKCEADWRSQRGFSLIEMAIVMTIIGVLVAAVVSAKDIMNSASSLRAYKRFVVPCVAEATKNIFYTGESLGAVYDPDEPTSLRGLSPLECDIQAGGIIRIVNADDELKDIMRRSLHNGQDVIVNRPEATITIYQPGGV